MSAVCLIACAGPSEPELERTLLFAGAVAQAGGMVVMLTHAPGLALRRTFFGLEVIVRHHDDLGEEAGRLLALIAARRARVVLLDDRRIGPQAAPVLKELLLRVAVARYGPAFAAGAGELVIDPYGPYHPPGPGCLGLTYLPLHPGLRPLRDGRPVAPAEVERVTIACRDDQVGRELAIHAMEALSVWRPTLQVTALCEMELPRQQKSRLDQAIQLSRHDVTLRPLPVGPQIGEALLCDLAIVDDPERAQIAAYLGTPAVLLSTGPDDARAGEALARRGAIIHLPCLREGMLPPALFADLVWSLCADRDRRAGIADEGRRALDGYGAERVAAALFELDRTHRAA